MKGEVMIDGFSDVGGESDAGGKSVLGGIQTVRDQHIRDVGGGGGGSGDRRGRGSLARLSSLLLRAHSGLRGASRWPRDLPSEAQAQRSAVVRLAEFLSAAEVRAGGSGSRRVHTQPLPAERGGPLRSCRRTWQVRQILKLASEVPTHRYLTDERWETRYLQAGGRFAAELAGLLVRLQSAVLCCGGAVLCDLHGVC